jgi:hypothetical protein
MKYPGDANIPDEKIYARHIPSCALPLAEGHVGELPN